MDGHTWMKTIHWGEFTFLDDLRWTVLYHNGWFEFLMLRKSKGLPAKIKDLFDINKVVQTRLGLTYFKNWCIKNSICQKSLKLAFLSHSLDPVVVCIWNSFFFQPSFYFVEFHVHSPPTWIVIWNISIHSQNKLFYYWRKYTRNSIVHNLRNWIETKMNPALIIKQT